MKINPLFFSKPFLATLFLLTIVSAWSYEMPSHQGKVLGIIDFQPVLTSNSQLLTSNFQSPAPLPIQTNQNLPTPQLTAKAVLVLDRAGHTLLFEKNAHQRLPPASLTKIMTALLTLENLPLEQVVVVGEVVNGDNGSSMHLLAGERISVENLLWGLLLPSDNDAATVLAQALGEKLMVQNSDSSLPPQFTNQQFNNLTIQQFVSLMNSKAALLHLQNTRFENPVGFDEVSHFSTAYDLAILTNAALKYSILAQMVATLQKTVSSVDGKISHPLYSTNLLLGKVEGVQGVKTGTSDAAEECLVVLVEREGHAVLLVILGSETREEDAKKLIEWVYKNFIWD